MHGTKFALIVTLVALAFGLTGCFQTSSDGDLRDVPVTNNPYVIPQSSRSNMVPGIGM